MENNKAYKINDFSIKAAFAWAFTSFKKDWKKFVVITVILIAISFVFSAIGAGRGIRPIFSAIGQILTFWLGFNMIKIYLDYVFGRKTRIKDLFFFSTDSKYLKKIIKYLLVSILYIVIIFIGLVFLIVPGIYFAIKFQYASYNVIEKGSSIGDAFRLSSSMTVGVKWKMILFYITNLLAILVGFICLGVGIIPASIIVMLAQVYVYKKLLQDTEGHSKKAEVKEVIEIEATEVTTA